MDLNYTPEEQAFRADVRKFVTASLPADISAKVKGGKRLAKEDFVRWQKVLHEKGWGATMWPLQFGGTGWSAVQQHIFEEECAEAGAPLQLPFGLKMVALEITNMRVLSAEKGKKGGHAIGPEASILKIKGSEIQQTIAGGELMMALAHFEPGGRYKVSRVDTAAKAKGDGWTLTGAKGVVLSGGAAGKLLVSARTSHEPRDDRRKSLWDEDGISLFLVDRQAKGVSVRSYMTQDGGRAADIRFDEVELGPEALLGNLGAALPDLERALDYGRAALCAEAVGIMTALNEATLEYLKTRKQFGQPIGRFQALQHRMVDMVIATEQARSMATLAAVKADATNAAERRRALSAAKAYVGQQARFVGQQAVQLHGGMGVVDELNVSHYFKRLTMINATFGDADHHLGLFSDMLLAA